MENLIGTQKSIPLGPRNAWGWHWPRNWGFLASNRLWPGGPGRAGGPGESGQVQAGGGDEDSLALGGGFGGGGRQVAVEFQMQLLQSWGSFSDVFPA
jgi:hypothetical protein